MRCVEMAISPCNGTQVHWYTGTSAHLNHQITKHQITKLSSSPLFCRQCTLKKLSDRNIFTEKMGKVILNITVSLDGFIAGEQISKENPLGINGPLLHRWIFD